MGVGRIGVALGSGSARGWAHIGVLRALAARGLRPSVVAGASVGALVGGAYASGQLDALEAWVTGLTKVDVWRLLDASFGGGVMSGNRLMAAIREQVEDRPIETLPVAFAAVATDLDTGHEVWLREGPFLGAARASSGLPGLFSPLWHQGRWLVDGGVVNPVPVSLCRALGADYVIAVNLNSQLVQHAARRRRPAGTRERDPQPAPAEDDGFGGWTSLEKWAGLVEGVVQAFKGDRPEEPGLLDVMASSINIMQDRITRSRMVGDPPAVVLSPALGHFHLMDFHRASEAIDVGRRAVERAAAELDELVAAAGGTTP